VAAQHLPMKDLGKAFSFPFKDPDWVAKHILGALFTALSFLLIGIPFVAGYFVQVTQRVMHRQEPAMPSWSGLGEKFLVGLRFCVVYGLYLAPTLLLLVPLLVLAAAAEVANDSDVLALLTVIYSFGYTLAVIPYSLALTLATPIILYRFAERGIIGDALDVRALIREFRGNWQNVLIVALISLGLQSFASVGVIVFLIGMLFTIWYAYLVSAYLGGLLYLERPEERQLS